MNRRLITLLAETYIHPGEGQARGVVDQPVARESATGLPFIPGHSHKGAIKAGAELRIDALETEDHAGARALEAAFYAVFGDTDNEGVGRLLVGDAQIVLLPLRARGYPFVLATSRYLLLRLARIMTFSGRAKAADELHSMVYDLSGPARGSAVVSDEVSVGPDGGPRKAEIQGYELSCHRPPRTPADRAAAGSMPQAADGGSEAPTSGTEADTDVRKRIAAHLSKTLGLPGFIELDRTLAILHDDDFDFFTSSALPVRARNSLDENKRSVNLWYEETLPPDTVMCTWLGERELIGSREEEEDQGEGNEVNRGQSPIELVLNALRRDEQGPLYLQCGGNESVGQGWFQVFPYQPQERPNDKDA